MDSDLRFSPEPKSLFGEPSAPPRAPKTAVWGDDTVKSARSRKSALSGIFEQERFQSARLTRLDSDDDIPTIPDVEDIHDEDHLGDIADAPRVVTNFIPSLSELNADLRKQSLFKIFEGINVGILSDHLYKENEIKEMFQLLTSHFHSQESRVQIVLLIGRTSLGLGIYYSPKWPQSFAQNGKRTIQLNCELYYLFFK